MTKTKLAVVAALMTGLVSPAFAQGTTGYDNDMSSMSGQRAEAIQHCQQQADHMYGPSGVRDWRRYDHDYYASCMASMGQPE